MGTATLGVIRSVRPIVGLEVHVQLATRTKMFSTAGNGAHVEFDGAAPNGLIDPVVLGLPGALPVMSREAVEMAARVGLALGCSLAGFTKWDRKSYFYPDLPKGYQISQYDLPICFDGAVDLPSTDERGSIDLDGAWTRIGILRAHLEEDAGKLLHESPGGGAIDASLADYNRAGSPLLEIVTQPDFTSGEQVVAFAKLLRNICRFLGVSEGVMQKGHMRFEPNINCEIELEDGKLVRTPIVEVKNLNSFKAVRGAIEYELAQQPGRWLEDGRQFGAGTKTTRGWDDERGVTFVQREKEDAHDYRYFPDPDLVPVVIDDAWKAELSGSLPELPLARLRKYVSEYGLGVKEAQSLVDERDVCFFYEAAIEELALLGCERARAGKLAANFLLQAGLKRANERSVLVNELGITAKQVAAIAWLREQGKLNNQSADELFGELCDASRNDDVEKLAGERGWLIVRDDAAMERWVAMAIGEQPQAAQDVREGKQQAIGRLVGAAMKHAGGKADAKTVREAILKTLGG